MAHVVVLTNPLDTSRRTLHRVAAGTPLLAWVDEHAPPVAQAERAVYLRGEAVTDRAYLVRDGDEVLVTFGPGWAQVGWYVLQAIIAAAIGYVINKIFGPTKPKSGTTPSPSQVYGIAQPSNQARLGQPIPVIYGAVICLPDFAAQPYVEFINNEQYLRALLCIGQGQHDVTEALLGDSSAMGLSSDVMSWRVYQPTDHASTFGVIQNDTGVRENCATSSDVADQELLAPNVNAPLVPSTWYWLSTNVYQTTSPPGGAYHLEGAASAAQKIAILPANPAIGTVVSGILGFNGSTYTVATYQAATYTQSQTVPPQSLVPAPTVGAGAAQWIGPFQTCKAGQAGALIELDYVFAGGLYTMDSSGNLQSRTISVNVETTQIDDTGADIAGTTATRVETFTAANNTPQRFTRPFAVPSARYRVRLSRSTFSDLKVNTADACTWAGLKFVINPPPAGALTYGDVTLVALTLKATNGVAASAADSMRFRTTRRLAPLGTGTPVATSNPADAFVDVLVARYGGNRPLTADEIDLVELANSRTLWAGVNGFNAVFDQPSTVWEALGLTVQCVNAAPMPLGSRMTVIHDGPQPVQTQVFMDGNIASGSLTVTDAFDVDGTPVGVRVEYRDPRTFSEAAWLQPPDAPDYTTISLFGCTDVTVAQQQATLAANKRQLQRQSIQFTTELEGLSCLPGDRIGVQSLMMGWAQGARVVAVAGLVVQLDRPLDWSVGSSFAASLRDPQGVPHRVTGVVRGASDHELVLPGAPPFALVGVGDTLEPTLIAFGAAGAELTDWTVTTMQPQGDTVTIQAINYVPTLWAGAAAYQQPDFQPLEPEPAS